jgi:cytochrome c-type biogenesis protein CcmH
MLNQGTAGRTRRSRRDLFWIIARLMTLGAALALALPLFDARRLKSDDSFALEVYRDQLSELGRDEVRGLLSPDQAKAAQIEIERRILALDPAPVFLPAEPPGHGLTLAMAVILPLVGFAFYLALGQPQMPGRPLAERAGELAALTSPEIVQLERRLAASPSDAQAWIDLGHAYGRLERAGEAAEAFAKAIALGAATGTSLRARLILSRDGMVVPEAGRAETGPGRRSADPMARFFLALAKAQDGDVDGALGDWIALEASLPADSSFGRPAHNIDKAAAELGRIPRPCRALARPAPGTGEIGEAMVAAMSPRSAAFIRAMVERLAQRLEEDPAKIEDWLKLARSYEVLGEDALARATWAKAASLAPARLDIQLDYASALIRGRPDLGRELPEGFAELVTRIRTLDADNPLGLFYAGMVERVAGRNGRRVRCGARSQVLLPEGSAEQPSPAPDRRTGRHRSRLAGSRATRMERRSRKCVGALPPWSKSGLLPPCARAQNRLMPTVKIIRWALLLSLGLGLAACSSAAPDSGPFAYGAEAYLVQEQSDIIEAHLRDPLPVTQATLIDNDGLSMDAIEITRDRVVHQSAAAPWPGFGVGIFGGSSGHVSTGFGLGIPLFGGGGGQTVSVNESYARFRIPDIDRYQATWQKWKIHLVLGEGGGQRVIEMLPPAPPAEGL